MCSRVGLFPITSSSRVVLRPQLQRQLHGPARTEPSISTASGGHLAQGQNALWQASAPAGSTIVGVNASVVVVERRERRRRWRLRRRLLLARQVTQNIQATMTSFGALMSSSFFGFQLVCGKPTCTQYPYADLGGITLYVRETAGPNFTAPSGLCRRSGMGPRLLASIRIERLPVGRLLIVSDSQRLARRSAGRRPSGQHPMASMRGAADQPDDRHRPLRPGSRAAFAVRERRRRDTGVRERRRYTSTTNSRPSR